MRRRREDTPRPREALQEDAALRQLHAGVGELQQAASLLGSAKPRNPRHFDGIEGGSWVH